MSSEKVRVDRWLWSVRAYKTRTLATDACRRRWVKVNGTDAKPSRDIKAKDIVTYKIGPLEKKVQVIKVIEKRVSAKSVDQYLEDLTPKSSYEAAETKRRNIVSSMGCKRASKGRPSKKERRDFEEFFYKSDQY